MSPLVLYQPINDLFVVTADDYFLLRRDKAKSVFLASPGLSVCDVCTQVHVQRPLRQRAQLEENQSIQFTSAEIALLGDTVVSMCNERAEGMRFEGSRKGGCVH